MRIRVSLATAAVLCCVWSGAAEAHKVTLGTGLYTEYGKGGSSLINFIVCGSVGSSMGCYGSGRLGPFEQPCAVLEGKAKQKKSVVKRAIYVLDKRSSNAASMTLTVFTRIDTFGDNSDSIQVRQTKLVPLGVTGGPDAKCSMAGNDAFVYAGTDAQNSVVVIDKKAFTISTIQKSGDVQSITADDQGDVALNFGDFSELFDPQGNQITGAEGPADVVGTLNAWKP